MVINPGRPWAGGRGASPVDAGRGDRAKLELAAPGSSFRVGSVSCLCCPRRRGALAERLILHSMRRSSSTTWPPAGVVLGVGRRLPQLTCARRDRALRSRGGSAKWPVNPQMEKPHQVGGGPGGAVEPGGASCSAVVTPQSSSVFQADQVRRRLVEVLARPVIPHGGLRVRVSRERLRLADRCAAIQS